MTFYKNFKKYTCRKRRGRLSQTEHCSDLSNERPNICLHSADKPIPLIISPSPFSFLFFNFCSITLLSSYIKSELTSDSFNTKTLAKPKIVH